MLPHLRYDSRFLEDYFPGPDWWPRAQRHVARAGISTSGISNPPILPIAARLIGERQPDVERRLEFWRAVVGPLAAWLWWFLAARRPGRLALPLVVHPWEAGWDNSPRWDRLSQARLKPARAYERLDTRHVGAEERPSGKDYDAYLALAELLDGADYDAETYLARAPFAVHDVVVDALWYGAASDVNAMAAEIEEPAPFEVDMLEAYGAGFDAIHWNAARGSYLDFDAVAAAPIDVQSAAAPAALAGGLITHDRAAALWRGYREACRPGRLVCTVPPGAPEFEPARYWRGPVWLSVNWLVIRGLRGTGLHADADAVVGESLELVERHGFREYFDALSGEGRGIDGFTWTAALALDLLAER